jgi:hypothetical protein
LRGVDSTEDALPLFLSEQSRVEVTQRLERRQRDFRDRPVDKLHQQGDSLRMTRLAKNFGAVLLPHERTMRPQAAQGDEIFLGQFGGDLADKDNAVVRHEASSVSKSAAG